MRRKRRKHLHRSKVYCGVACWWLVFNPWAAFWVQRQELDTMWADHVVCVAYVRTSLCPRSLHLAVIERGGACLGISMYCCITALCRVNAHKLFCLRALFKTDEQELSLLSFSNFNLEGPLPDDMICLSRSLWISVRPQEVMSFKKAFSGEHSSLVLLWGSNPWGSLWDVKNIMKFKHSVVLFQQIDLQQRLSGLVVKHAGLQRLLHSIFRHEPPMGWREIPQCLAHSHLQEPYWQCTSSNCFTHQLMMQSLSRTKHLDKTPQGNIPSLDQLLIISWSFLRLPSRWSSPAAPFHEPSSKAWKIFRSHARGEQPNVHFLLLIQMLVPSIASHFNKVFEIPKKSIQKKSLL